MGRSALPYWGPVIAGAIRSTAALWDSYPFCAAERFCFLDNVAATIATPRLRRRALLAARWSLAPTHLRARNSRTSVLAHKWGLAGHEA
jgi:hypothetical protein